LKRGLGICWVAREVYGAADIRWRIFQSWLLTSAPRWLLQLYTGYGEGFAAWLRAHAWAKPMVRRLMDCVVQPRLRRILYA